MAMPATRSLIGRTITELEGTQSSGQKQRWPHMMDLCRLFRSNTRNGRNASQGGYALRTPFQYHESFTCRMDCARPLANPSGVVIIMEGCSASSMQHRRRCVGATSLQRDCSFAPRVGLLLTVRRGKALIFAGDPAPQSNSQAVRLRGTRALLHRIDDRVPARHWSRQ